MPDKQPDPEKEEKLDQSLNLKTFRELLEYLTSLAHTDRRSVNQGNIGIRRELVEKASDQEIFTWINKSTPEDWQKHPSYYHALIERARNREMV